MSQDPFAADPFPLIPPALLNSADLRAYAESGKPGSRLFEPFFPDELGRLKSASYEISFRGTSYSWSMDDPTRNELRLKDADELEIPRNGIVFMWPDVFLNVPPYLALRFNLSIRLVHRGLLLGTGPLVDPGYRGQLLIPVHNLTDRPLKISPSDGFIWIEVTKVSPFPPIGEAHDCKYVEFPEKKGGLAVGAYFEKANQGAPIRSSIPAIAAEAQKVTDSLQHAWREFEGSQVARTDSIEKTVKKFQIISLVAIFLTLVGMLLSVYQIAESTKQLVESTKALVMAAQQSVDGARSRGDDDLRKFSEKLMELESRLGHSKAVTPTIAPASQSGAAPRAN